MTVYDFAERVGRLHPAVDRCATCDASEVEIRADGHRFDFFGVWVSRRGVPLSLLQCLDACPEGINAKVDLAGGECE